MIATLRAAAPEESGVPHAIVAGVSYDFGTTEQGTKLVHQFSIRNEGTAPLTVTHVTLSAAAMTASPTT